MKKTFYFSAILLTAASSLMLTNCSSGGGDGGDGGGGDGSGDPTPPVDPQEQDVTVTRTELKGVAIDPYIVNASICADLNNNNQCDAGEPQGETGELGEFDLGDWPDDVETVKLLLENRGSWEIPQYGLHEGKPYGMPLSVIARADVQVRTANPDSPPPPPEIKMTPATSLEAAYSMGENDVLALLNSYKDQLGKTFTAADLTADPLTDLDGVPFASLTEEQLASFRAYLVLYGVNSIMNSVRSLGVADAFKSQVMQTSPTRQIMTTMVDAVVTATDLNGQLKLANDEIAAGEQAMQEQIRAGVPAFAPPGTADSVINQVGSFPPLTADVVMSVGVAMSEFRFAQAQQWVKEALNEDSPSYESVTDYVAQQLQDSFGTGAEASVVLAAPGELGMQVYAQRNRNYFEGLKTKTFSGGVPANLGQTIFDGIIQAVPNAVFTDGFDCEGRGFFLFNAEGVTQSRCTSALPVNLREDIAGFAGIPPGEEWSDEDSPVDVNIWDHLPVGSVQISDLPLDQTCDVSGVVYKDSAGTVAAGVPMYFNYGPSPKEINLKTDAEGKFAFTRIPGLKYPEDNWPDEEAKDHYFIGVIAGARRPVPDYLGYEANADYHINCRLINDGGQIKAYTGGNGDEDGNGNLITRAKPRAVEFYPQLRPLADGTMISGSFPTALVNMPSFSAEIHSQQRFYSGDISSEAVYDGGWIMDSIANETGPFTSLDIDTGVFSVTGLAGGNYRLRIAYLNEETEDPDDWIECETEPFAVSAGAETDLTAAQVACAP